MPASTLSIGKQIAKGKKRDYTHDTPMGPKGPKHRRSTIVTLEQEGAIVAFGKHTLLPLDDCLYGLKGAIPALTRFQSSSLLPKAWCEQAASRRAAPATGEASSLRSDRS